MPLQQLFVECALTFDATPLELRGEQFLLIDGTCLDRGENAGKARVAEGSGEMERIRPGLHRWVRNWDRRDRLRPQIRDGARYR
jgi:hypothetical protein